MSVPISAIPKSDDFGILLGDLSISLRHCKAFNFFLRSLFFFWLLLFRFFLLRNWLWSWRRGWFFDYRLGLWGSWLNL